MAKPWKSCLQELCQKRCLPSPNYRFQEQTGPSNQKTFQADVEVDGQWYTGDDLCSKKKDAENSVAHKAFTDLMEDSAEQTNRKYLPIEYADIEEYIRDMVGSFGGRIRKARAPSVQQRLYRVEITGDYRYCDNVQRHHKNNRIYFLVDPVRRVYFQRCYDPHCSGFQSAMQQINTPLSSS